MLQYEVVIIGGGSAGMGAAIGACEGGAKKVLIIERDRELGGILQQCIHNGFGLHKFKEELTGPQYANRYIEKLKQYPVEIMLNTMVTNLTNEKSITILNEQGEQDIKASAVVLAMGCRENNRQALSIPGTRPVGILTAGTAQRYLNLDGYLVGKKVFIVGSGDIGLIMARRMALEGAEVLGVAEIMPYSNGLTRNIVQCLEDFNIPLFLSHTVTDIKGNRRVEGVTISEVDADRQPILGTEKQFEVDAILFSVGLIPDNGLSKKAGVIFDPATKGACVFENLETTVSGIFACGNVLHVHDLVDFVSDEAERAGYYAALYALGHLGHDDGVLEVKAGEGIKYALPQKIRPKELEASLELMYRVTKKYQQAIVNVVQDGKIVHQLKRHVLLPAEMEKIKIPTEVLNSSGKDLTIEVKCLYNS